MSQAKTLDERELRRVLDHVATRPHAARNRAMIVMTFYLVCEWEKSRS